MENNVQNMIQFKMAAKYPRWLPEYRTQQRILLNK